MKRYSAPMRVVLALAGLAAPCAGAVLRSSTFSVSREGHPIESVIKLLKELKQKVLEEGEAEEVTYAKFAQWCTNSERSLEKSVEKLKEDVDVLESEIDAKTKENATLTEEIASLEEEITKYEAADKDATKEREAAKKLYEQADKDLESSIKAFDEVITELETAKTGTAGASLVQGAVRKALTVLSASALGSLSDSQLQRLQEAAGKAEPKDGEKEVPDFLAKGDYGDHVKKYEFKSGNVIELMKELKLNFEDERVEGTKRETAAQNAYDLAKNARDAALEAAKTTKGEKTTTLGEVQSELATAEGSLKDAKADLKADEKNLEDTKKDCMMKKSEWEERSSLRQKEVEAMDAGVAILAKVSGVRTEAPTNPALPASPEAALLAKVNKLRFSFVQGTDPKAKAVNLLREEARRLHSQAFTRFAEDVAAKVQGPFDDVNDMIQKMIFRLMAEQKDEDEHKTWCDTELSKTNASKINKEEKIVELDLKLDEAKADRDLLTTAIQEADEAVAELTAFMEEATEVRTAGKKENEAAIKDAKNAQDAIAQAVAVLEQFYKESGSIDKEALTLMQEEGAAPVDLPDKPSTWEASYTGVADPKKQPQGIITVLEKTSSDFSQMEADTKAQEVTDQKNYQEEMKSSEIEKARRVKESEMKTQEKQRLVQKIASLEKSKKHTVDELGAVKQYLKDLSPACLEGDSTYEDRKSARTKEIEALKEAQVILLEANDKPTPAPAGFLLHSATKLPQPHASVHLKTASSRHLRSVTKH